MGKTIEVTTAKKCNHPGCVHDAIYKAVFELKASPSAVPQQSTTVARLCDEHSTGNLWQTFYTPEQWQLITDAFRGMGLRKPKEQFSNIKLIKL